MYIPDIPSVSTSVIDRSTIDVTVGGDRVVLVPGFFKYGKEGFKLFVNNTEFRNACGKKDLNKYGLAYEYIEGALRSNKALVYRLLPDDATYANNTISPTGTFATFPGLTSKEMLYALDAGKNDVCLSALAANRGEGYNSLFVTFSPAYETEKMESNMVGEPNYKFNFVQCEIFEESATGVKSLGDPIVFSLIDVDSDTNEPIISKNSGLSLFVNNIFKDNNEFATLNVNPYYIEEMRQNRNIDDLTDHRLIVQDSVTVGKYYEIKVEDYIRVEKDNNGVDIRVEDTRLTTVITNTKPRMINNTPEPQIIKFDNGVDVIEKVITVTNGVISLINKPANEVGEPRASYKIDGTSAFYDLKIDSDGNAFYTEVVTLRHTIYKNLMDYSFRMYNGSDGLNLHKNGKLNMFGTSAVGKQNAMDLLTDFYNNNKEIKEILYPKYDFDYIPDWANTTRTLQAIVSLADSIGVSMPILSVPLMYDPTITTRDLVEKDLLVRKEGAHYSSYHSALYSGQQNKNHRTDGNLRIYMPMSYYAMMAHLKIDSEISITEPVANVVKGTLDSSEINLTYEPTSLEIESLRREQINSIIVEPDGTYIIDQLTMYKRASKLSRINVVKVIHRLRKDLPKVLKDLLQNKAINDITDTAIRRANKVLEQWVVTPENSKDGIFSNVSIVASYNEASYKLRLAITVNPIGTLEQIEIPIIVV
ncbi:MAG: hypothetical protein WC136_02130 [Sphaerochaeta sp.]|jgi:hypothetical protein